MESHNTHTFLMRLNNEGIALNPDLLLSFSSTNLPYDAMKLREETELYWLVRIKAYDKSLQHLTVEVESYEPEDITAFFSQDPKSPIARLDFAMLRWAKLSPHLVSYSPAAFRHLLDETPGTHTPSNPSIVERSRAIAFARENGEFIVKTNVPFTKARFVSGGVLISHKLDGQEIEIHIPNPHILREFDILKEFFGKALGKKQFTVRARIVIEQGKIKDIEASSPDIAKIDERMLETVRYLEAKKIHKSGSPDPDRELFTALDLNWKTLDEDDVQGLRLLEILIRDEAIRNRKHIQYLAGKMHMPAHKILFTAQPQFGFVFHVEGNSMMHFVWELLNSHATYLWSYDPMTLAHNLALRKLEYTLSQIRNQGRQSYRMEMYNDLGITELTFHVINHDNVSSETSDSFPLWRMRLHERLL